MEKDSKHERYVDLLRQIPDKKDTFLAWIFSAFFEQWLGGFIILIERERKFDNPLHHEPFCSYVRHRSGLNLENTCIECDDTIAKKVLYTGTPEGYWCDWGMRDIAVPIVVEGINVGIFFCGQKILDDPEDYEGRMKMLEFAKKKGLEGDTIRTLFDLRKKTTTVSLSEILKMQHIIWATSKYISQILHDRYNRYDCLNYETDESENELIKLFDKLSEIIVASDSESFFLNYKEILEQFSSLFECQGITVLLSDMGSTRLVSSSDMLLKLESEDISEKNIITSDVNALHGPHHHDILRDGRPNCIVCEEATRKYPGINMILYEKAQMGLNKSINFIILFDTSVSRRNSFSLQQIKKILSKLVIGTLIYFHLESKISYHAQ